ncbi:hypothetical protein BVY04_05255 [bacterium M21]|nr:hypothetical protein BVY04_05255 [bacterium M21]
MANATGNILSKLIFLVLIGAALFGAKIMVFDDMIRAKKLSEAKTAVTQLVDKNEYEEALTVCDKFEKTYPKEKKFCNGRRAAIYIKWADASYEKMMEAERSRSKASRAKDKARYRKYDSQMKKYGQTALAALDNLEECEDISKRQQQYRVIIYGALGDHKRARAESKRHAQMD